MAKSHKQHLKDHGYQVGTHPNGRKYDAKTSDQVYQRIAAKYGSDNVWDYRILDVVFDTSNAHYTYEMYWNVVKRDTGETGRLSSRDKGNDGSAKAGGKR